MNKESTQLASEKLGSSQAHAKKAYDTTASAAKEIVGAARSAAQSAYRESKDELSAAARDMSEAARVTCTSLAEQTALITQEYREKLSDLEVEVVDYVREKPLQSVAIAFSIGLLAGIILNRK